MEEIIKDAAPEQTTVEVVDIQFRPGQKIYFLIPQASPAKPVTM